ncbi:two-component system, NtrC family, response regulator AtoC [Proteiniborus ethanoligenes]|uniref:Stage 0 sporulation protein A homolog n=1 Tax=Proteiniborus ethanoligenes TaxID=415015 RepID=A0A1H3ML46_9FIRM|nr:sigma-54 dependent transcriptional regulator [Proteiniborus ethanoligenes]SDY77316.1 two-component system, NtrC family, response regulator AtoC [Proteiniborus ethanoligenes]
MNKILIIDDEISICDSLTFALEDEYEVFSTQEVEKAYEIVSSNIVDVILLDLKLGNVDGIEVLKTIKSINDDIQVIIMTAFGSIKSSVNAIKEGAFHYITKPLDMEELLIYIQKALEYKKLSGSLTNLKEVVNREYGIEGIIGQSEALQQVLKRVIKIKDIDSTVLITGESGTGKDLIAKALHFQGIRRDENFQVVNCAAIPSNLLESELFGYEKGAFTGAEKKKLGKIQLAHKGTLFLDEIGEMDLQLQAKILRVVEDMQVVPLGGEKGVHVDVRIIAATNKDLEEEVNAGRFREDLYYRLNVITIKLPPLRERKGDIPIFLDYFLKKYNKKLNKSIKGFEKAVVKALESYNYPGNVRELENLIERLVALSDEELITLDDLPLKYRQSKIIIESDEFMVINMGTTLKEAEKKLILNTLKYFNGNRRQTAECLNISERNLHYKIKEYEKGN